MVCHNYDKLLFPHTVHRRQVWNKAKAFWRDEEHTGVYARRKQKERQTRFVHWIFNVRENYFIFFSRFVLRSVQVESLRNWGFVLYHDIPIGHMFHRTEQWKTTQLLKKSKKIQPLLMLHNIQSEAQLKLQKQMKMNKERTRAKAYTHEKRKKKHTHTHKIIISTRANSIQSWRHTVYTVWNKDYRRSKKRHTKTKRQTNIPLAALSLCIEL